MFLQMVIEEFLIYCASIKSFSPNTTSGYKNDLQIFSILLEKQGLGTIENIKIQDITLQNLRSCIGYLSKEKKLLRQLTVLYLLSVPFLPMLIEWDTVKKIHH